jgi:HAMP domain-containing protein
MGNESIEALRKSISGISDVVTTDANFNPIIRPVLDLTDVKNQASQIGSILTPTPIRTDEVLALAKSVSAEISDGQQARQEAQAGSTTTVNYTQNNTSPKALSSAEIYRNTKSQLSTKKGALDK